MQPPSARLVTSALTTYVHPVGVAAAGKVCEGCRRGCRDAGRQLPTHGVLPGSPRCWLRCRGHAEAAAFAVREGLAAAGLSLLPGC